MCRLATIRENQEYVVQANENLLAINLVLGSFLRIRWNGAEMDKIIRLIASDTALCTRGITEA